VCVCLSDYRPTATDTANNVRDKVCGGLWSATLAGGGASLHVWFAVTKKSENRPPTISGHFRRRETRRSTAESTSPG